MAKANHLRDKSAQELQELEAKLLREIFQMKNEAKASKKYEKPHLIREKKRERARALTLLTQMKNAQV